MVFNAKTDAVAMTAEVFLDRSPPILRLALFTGSGESSVSTNVSMKG